ncbi:hypothetical protein HBA55_16940 [Pseudomaricurvus alkylphenolicus]|jgi:hypothetical protein|uniref:hypothetical protein n=1 Tax=Pseudomaricurvus alkylphenolicus TaxID=1306991 RepID=UPI00141EB7B3|nr:hypothetical protein [Pseudomaricurvus alkylphenolicus]NIB41291.1 hypothetical protein [Pseudomaricurvus alkylphenolicus]
MSAFASLVIFCALAVLSLVTVSVINEREKRQKALMQKIKRLKHRARELEELVVEVDLLVESRAIARLINEEILELILAMKAADESATYLDASYQAAIARSENLADEGQVVTIDRLKGSDAQIARSQRSLEEAAGVIRKQQRSGKISLEEMNIFLSELSWAHLMVDVISHVAQGHRAINRNDVLSGHAFYKKAQQLLMQSAHSDKRRHRMIKELAEILSNRRRALSEDLMPETRINPEESAPQSS